MSLHHISLNELTQSAQTCSELTSLGAALEILSQNQDDRLVVVDEQRHPIGLVQLKRLLPLVLPDVTPHPILQAALPTADRFKVRLQDVSTVMEPLLTLPQTLTLPQLPNLKETQATYAVVSTNGDFVGLLDCDRLLQLLAENLTEPPQPDEQAPPQQQITQLTQQLLAQRAELEQRIKTQQDELNQLRLRQQTQPRSEIFSPASMLSAASAGVPLLNSLLHLLERLPLPLMLQTNSGQVLAQNSVWRQQVGELSDPIAIWREAAVWLNLQGQAKEDARSPIKPTPHSDLLHSGDAIDASAFSTLEQSLCQVGTSPDTCVCVCPLHDGREQVLQFAKISLGTLLPDLVVPDLKLNSSTGMSGEVGMACAIECVAETVPFQLATLTTPDCDTLTPIHHPEASSLGRSSNTTTVQASELAIESLWIVLAQDVTKQQHLARELTAKNADLVQLNRLKDEFLACISHELKTPLTAVLGLSSLLKDQTLGELNQRQVHYAQLIYQSSRHLMGVVNDILDLTRIETGQLELLYEPVSIATVCSRAFEQAKQTRVIESRNPEPLEEEQITAHFSLEIEPDLDVLVADDLRLRQMLVHLLSNSLKFTEVGNSIGLRVGCWGGWIAFTVWDTGIGIAAEKQHLIFQKFQQLENPLTRRFEGAGLGLVLTRRLARLHGGDVTFTSKAGQGSQFTILLPPHPPQKNSLSHKTQPQNGANDHEWAGFYPGGQVSFSTQTIAATPDAIAPPHRNRLVLLVDAVPQQVEALTDQLTGLGYRVVIARSGTEALEKARRIQPGVIFLNPLLPLLSGWDVLTLLKSNMETQHLPVVITASGTDEEQADRHQANGFLRLPIQTGELQRSLQQLMMDAKEPPDPAASNLTILRLSPSGSSNQPAATTLDELLRSQPYRILEADDLEQAELVARVWKPDIVLLDSTNSVSLHYIRQLSHHKYLASLPLVTLDQQTTQAANQISGLLVFPCLASSEAKDTAIEPATLLQVMQIAAGYVWRPSVLAVDVSSLPLTVDATKTLDRTGAFSFPQEIEWLQALMQYLHTAGLRGLIGRSWHEVLQQVQSQSVDLLLLCWTNGEPAPDVMAMLTKLSNANPKPPIIVLDHRDPELGETTLIPMPGQVQQLATQILSPPILMTELLAHMHEAIDTRK